MFVVAVERKLPPGEIDDNIPVYVKGVTLGRFETVLCGIDLRTRLIGLRYSGGAAADVFLIRRSVAVTVIIERLPPRLIAIAGFQRLILEIRFLDP